MNKPVYVLGTGLSHDGSACLLKDGVIHVAIEKERISRIKHDGGNDSLAVQYCLDAAGITLNDLSLVVQCANFEKDEIRPDRYKGPRLFSSSNSFPIVTISHHLAHAWSAVGTCPFDQCNVLVIDGCGSFYHQCDDLAGAIIPTHVNSEPGLYGEKDSFYFFDGKDLQPLYKDFSIINYRQQAGQVYLPTSNHSIGGLYSMASQYCFGDFDDAGKLMGLAPYGQKAVYQEELLLLKDGHVWVDEAVMHRYFTNPADPVTRPFHEHFQYYADIARWVQDEAERALHYIFNHRHELHPFPKLCYAGGVALNAVANSKIFRQTGFEQFYIEPAAGDNGLALGCAFFGWISYLKQERKIHDGNTCFGITYGSDSIEQTLESFKENLHYQEEENIYAATADLLLQGKTVGWFQEGCEFGPRALGRRSILADPRNKDIQNHINSRIKFREDFRPFAPAVLEEDKDLYFQYGLSSPYMILVDQIKDEWKEIMPGIVHVDGSCRVQTVADKKEPFYQLLEEWKRQSGISVLLNTSFNKKGMPIVETPGEAISFFLHCSLDVLVIGNLIITKS
ncbi:MAG: transferase [Chitinophagaceae bacterium]|nr:transferase [Chitinophagaceae bacterium]